MAATMTGLREDSAECMEHLESAEEAMVAQRKHIQQNEEARAADSTRFDTHIAEVTAQLAYSEAARAEEKKTSAERISSSDAKAVCAVSELVAAKKSWADERQEMAATMTGLREDAAECMEHLESAEEAMVAQRELLRKSEESRTVDSTRFDTRLAKVTAQLAYSEAARVEELKRNDQRFSFSNKRTERAISELVEAKQSWSNERQEMAKTSTDLRKDMAECKDRLVSTENVMATQQVAANERVSTAEMKASSLEANVACLENDLAECKRAEHTSLARESTLQKERVKLHARIAEQGALEIDREAAFARERGLQAAANDAIAAERAAWDAERVASHQCHVKLKKDASALENRELIARKATRALQAEAEKSAQARKTLESELENSFVKSRRALLAEQAAASARSSTAKNEHASQLREVHERLTLCEAARKKEQGESALALSISEEKVSHTIQQWVEGEDARCAERNELTARLATLQGESEDNLNKHDTSAEETKGALKAVVHQREASLQAEVANMRERLEAAEGRFDTEHAENTRCASRLHTLGREANALRQHLVEAEEAQVAQRTKTAKDLRVLHQEIGKLKSRSERETKKNSDLVARLTDVERIQCDKQEGLRLEMATLVTERNTANDLLRDQELARTKERRTTAREMSALKNVLNRLWSIELAEERSLQVDRLTLGSNLTVAIDGDHERQSTVPLGAEGISQLAGKTTVPASSTVESHGMAPQWSSPLRREAMHLEQGFLPDKYVCSIKQASTIEEVSGLTSGAEYEPSHGRRSAYTRGESTPARVSSVRSSDPGTSSIENHVMANERSFASRHENIHFDQDLPPDTCAPSSEQEPAIKEQSYTATDGADTPVQGTRSACMGGESSPASVSSARSPDPGTRFVGDHTMAPQRSSALHREPVHVDQGLLSNMCARSTQQVPPINEASSLASIAEHEGFQGTRSACTRGEASFETVSSVRNSDKTTRSVEDHTMVPQRSSELRCEAIHLEQGLPPGKCVRNTKQNPAVDEVSTRTTSVKHDSLQAITSKYTRVESPSASISPAKSSDPGTIPVEDHAIAPQRSSTSRRELTHLEKGILPGTLTRNIQKTAITEKSDLATGKECEYLEGTRSAFTKGDSSSSSVSPFLVSGTGLLHAMPVTAEVLCATDHLEEVRLERDGGRSHVAAKTSTTRKEVFASLNNNNWFGQEPGKAPESAGAENKACRGRYTGSRRTVRTGLFASDGHGRVPSTSEEKGAVNIDRFQDMERSRRVGSRTPAPRNLNQHSRSGRGKPPIKSTMLEVSGGLEGIDKLPGSEREQRAGRLGARGLRPRSQREASLLATQVLNGHTERDRKTTGNAPPLNKMTLRREHRSSAHGSYFPRHFTHESRGGTSTPR